MSEVQQEVEQITRRSFLRRGLYGLAVVLAGSTGLALQPSRERGTPAAGLKVFSAREYAILCAVADRVMPAAPGLLSGSEMGVAEKLVTPAETPAILKLYSSLYCPFCIAFYKPSPTPPSPCVAVFHMDLTEVFSGLRGISASQPVSQPVS